jgi:hypothetical protein
MSAAVGDVEMAPVDGKLLNQAEEEEKLSCGQFISNIGKSAAAKTGADWGATFLRIFVLVFSIYFFLFSLSLMGTSFKVSQRTITAAVHCCLPHHHNCTPANHHYQYNTVTIYIICPH